MTGPQGLLLLAAVLPLRECDGQVALAMLASPQQRKRAAYLAHRKRRTALIPQRE